MPRGRFGAVFFRNGAVTGRGIRIGSTLAELRRATRAQLPAGQIFHGGRNYFLRRARAPHWEFRVDVSPGEPRDADRVRRPRVRTARRRVRPRRARSVRLPAEQLPGVIRIQQPARVAPDAVDDCPGDVFHVETCGDQLGAVPLAQPDGAQTVSPPFRVEVDQWVRGRCRQVIDFTGTGAVREQETRRPWR